VLFVAYFLEPRAPSSILNVCLRARCYGPGLYSCYRSLHPSG
jgi:hypothetical protein